MSAEDPALLQQCERFAEEIAGVLQRTVDPAAQVRARVHEDRVSLGPIKPDGSSTRIPLTISRRSAAWLDLSMSFGWDHAGRYLAVEKSQFAVGAHGVGEPLIRVEYVRARDYAPAHINLHAESSALGFLFGLAGEAHIPKVQQLHLPVGSKRFRPCLEDLLEFLAEDLSIDMVDGWRAAVEEGRRRWIQRQLGSVVRDDPTTAAAALQEAGYTVIPLYGRGD